MKKGLQNIIAVILVIAFFVGIAPVSKSSLVARAATMSLEELKAKFPQGAYWNHVGSSSNNENGYTYTPCSSHSSTSTCNAFTYGGTKLGWQCFGFALKLGYDAYGSNPKNWARAYNLNNIKPGDIINYNGNNPGHTVFVTGVSGNTVYIAECNYGGRCLIRWDRSLQKSQFSNLYNVYVAPYELKKSSAHVHSYSRGVEAAHPHKVYMKCSCGDYYYTGDTSFNANCSSCNNTSTISTYPTPFYAVTLSTGKTQVSSVNGVMNAKSNKIYSSDDCTIDHVYANGWCHVVFPLDAGGTADGYVPLSTFLDTSYSPSKITINTQTTTYRRSDGASNFGYIGSGDSVIKVGSSNSYTQVIYPLNSGGYKLAWAILPHQTNPVGSAVGCAEKWIAKANSGLNCRVSPGTSAAEVVAGYGIGYGGEIIIAKKQYDSDGNLWGWGRGYNNSLGKNLEGWYCLTYADFNYSYIPSVTSVNVAPVAYPDKTVITWSAADRATKYSVYIDGKLVVSNTTVRSYEVALQGGNHSVKVAAINTDFPYISSYDCYSITDPVSFTTKTKQYSVSYDANEGTGAPADQVKTYNTDLILSSTIPQREGHTFVGWAVAKNETVVAYNPGDTYKENAELSLVAVWKVDEYTITFDSNGGIGDIPSIKKTYGSVAEIPSEAPTRTGYKFIGWSENKEAVMADYTVKDRIYKEQDITLYAIWEEEATYVPGDINGDNVVNNKDLTRLMKYLAGEDVSVNSDALDVNGDGSVNNKDLTRLMKYLAGENVTVN